LRNNCTKTLCGIKTHHIKLLLLRVVMLLLREMKRKTSGVRLGCSDTGVEYG